VAPVSIETLTVIVWLAGIAAAVLLVLWLWRRGARAT
jgi:hypothetical protein